MSRGLVDGRSYYSYGQIHRALSDLASTIDKFKPDFMIAIGGGGLIPARMLRTKLKIPIYVVSLHLYDDDTHKAGERVEKVQWLDAIGCQKVRGKRLLVVDEVDDSRSTLKYCVDALRESCAPSALGVAVVHNKLRAKKAELPKDVEYFAADNVQNVWNCYPWDAADIDQHEHKARACAGESITAAL